MIFEAQKDFFKQNMKTVIDKETTLVNVIASKLYRDDETARAAGEGHSALTRSCEKTTTHSLCRGRTRDCDRLLTEKPSKGCHREKAPPSPPETEIQRRPPERLGAELQARSGAVGSVPHPPHTSGHAKPRRRATPTRRRPQSRRQAKPHASRRTRSHVRKSAREENGKRTAAERNGAAGKGSEHEGRVAEPLDPTPGRGKGETLTSKQSLGVLGDKNVADRSSRGGARRQEIVA